MLELLKRREKLKNEQVRVLARLTAVQANVHFMGMTSLDFSWLALIALRTEMNELLLRLEKEDTQHVFAGPTPAGPPTLPVNFSTIRSRLCALQYTSRAQFANELRAMLQAVRLVVLLRGTLIHADRQCPLRRNGPPHNSRKRCGY